MNRIQTRDQGRLKWVRMPTLAAAFAVVLAACAGPGFRSTTLESNAGASLIDMAVRTDLPSGRTREAANFLERHIPNRSFGASSAALREHITGIGGECNGQARITCVLNRREITQSADPAGRVGRSLKTWTTTISWDAASQPVRPAVRVSGSLQNLPIQ
jgi:hypothetical protein